MTGWVEDVGALADGRAVRVLCRVDRDVRTARGRATVRAAKTPLAVRIGAAPVMILDGNRLSRADRAAIEAWDGTP